MRRADMVAGMHIAYQVTGQQPLERERLIVEGIVIDPKWDNPSGDMTYKGSKVKGGGKGKLILVERHDLIDRYQADIDGRYIWPWGEFCAKESTNHKRHQHLFGARTAAWVTHVYWDSDDGGSFIPDRYKPGFKWQEVDLVGGDGCIRVPNDGIITVPVHHLFGQEFIDTQRRFEKYRQDQEMKLQRLIDDQRAAAERLGLPMAAISIGDPHALAGPTDGGFIHMVHTKFRTAVVLSQGQLVELLDRAAADPTWYNALVAEGIMEALGG